MEIHHNRLQSHPHTFCPFQIEINDFQFETLTREFLSRIQEEKKRHPSVVSATKQSEVLKVIQPLQPLPLKLPSRDKTSHKICIHQLLMTSQGLLSPCVLQYLTRELTFMVMLTYIYVKR
ncbi:hypothetical protein DMENIID0001_056730 [Sergentomyia squamirostris]